MAVLFTWVFQHTAGSVLLAILFHASWNLSADSAARADTLRSALVILLLKWVLAAIVVRGGSAESNPRGPHRPRGTRPRRGPR